VTPKCYSCYKPSDKSCMSKRPNCDCDKWNIIWWSFVKQIYVVVSKKTELFITLYAFFFCLQFYVIIIYVSMWRKNTLKQSINMVLLSIIIVQVKHLLPIDLKEIKWPKQMSMTWLTATNICVTNDHQIMFHLSQSQFIIT
jgi:hypothetical protein